MAYGLLPLTMWKIASSFHRMACWSVKRKQWKHGPTRTGQNMRAYILLSTLGGAVFASAISQAIMQTFPSIGGTHDLRKGIVPAIFTALSSVHDKEEVRIRARQGGGGLAQNARCPRSCSFRGSFHCFNMLCAQVHCACRP